MEVLKIEIWSGDIFKTTYVSKSDWNYVKAHLSDNGFEYLIVDQSIRVLGTGQIEALANDMREAA